MSSSLVKVVLATLLAQGAYALDFSPTPAPTGCTLTIYEFPPVETDCTFYQEKITSTAYTECHGCALKTIELGIGLPCRALTTIPGTSTKTETSCFGAGASATPTPNPNPNPINPVPSGPS